MWGWGTWEPEGSHGLPEPDQWDALSHFSSPYCWLKSGCYESTWLPCPTMIRGPTWNQLLYWFFSIHLPAYRPLHPSTNLLLPWAHTQLHREPLRP